MKFPKEWLDYGMYPEDLWEFQKNGFDEEHVEASEHDRNGAFHWWLRKDPTKDELIKLVKLTFLDPDPIMAADVRSHIRKHPNADQDVIDLGR